MAIGTPTRPSVYNLANQLTAARFVLGLVLFGLIELGWWVSCIIVFALAALTDWLDGYLARRYNLGSSLGRNLDPLVDKVVICGAYIFLLPVKEGDLSSGLAAWMVTIVVARELVITGLRSFMESYGAAFGADWLGKIKMGLQCAALFAIFTAFKMPEWSADLIDPVVVVRDGLIYTMLLTTALSGLQYLARAAVLLKED